MKCRSVFRIVSAVLLLAWALPLSTANAAPEEGKVYLALGDSLAYGWGATDPQRLGYVPHLYTFYQGMSHGNIDSLSNLAIGGETSGSFIAGGQLASALAAINDPETTIGVVTFDIGGNDLLNLLTTEPCASDPTGEACYAAAMSVIGTFWQNYTYILATLTPALATDPGQADLYIMTYYNPWSGQGSAMEAMVNAVLFGSDATVDCVANMTDPSRVGINDVLSCVGSAYGATIVDVYPGFVGKGLTLTHIAEGDIHPNNAGYAHIAAEFKGAYLDR
jgi:lysophospholipase L1-like esterase